MASTEIKAWRISQRSMSKPTCHIQSISSECFVSCPVSPVLSSSTPSDQTVMEGQPLTLRCNVTAGTPSPNVTWKKVNDSSKTFLSGQTLTFINVTRTDVGNYFCEADNGVGEAAKSREAVVTVHCKYTPDPPRSSCLRPTVLDHTRHQPSPLQKSWIRHWMGLRFPEKRPPSLIL